MPRGDRPRAHSDTPSRQQLARAASEIPRSDSESQFSNRCSASRNYSMRTWSLFSDGSSLTPALRSLPGFSSIKAEAGVWLVHNPVTLGHMLKECALCHRSIFIKLSPTRLLPCWNQALSLGVHRSLDDPRPGTPGT